MSTPDVISPAPVTSSSTRAVHPSSSIAPRSHQQSKFGSHSRRHTIAQPPSGSSRDSTVFTPPSQSGVIASLFPIMITPNYSINKLTSHKSGASVSIIIGQKLPQFFDRQASAAAAVVEREKREREQQSKEAIQMSTVNDQGTFLPPPPAEKGFLKDRFQDTAQDYFDTITRTPPERVKTFLSTAHRISPGSDHMTSTGKLKRGAIPASFVRISTTTTSSPVQPPQPQKALPVSVVAVRPLSSKVAVPVVKPTPPKSTSSSFSAPPSSHTPSSAEASLATPPSSPRTAAAVPVKDVSHATPLPVPRSRITAERFPSRRNTLIHHKEELSPLRTRTRAQMSFLTGDLDKPLSDEMEDALSDLIAPSSPSTSSEDESLSSSWSESTWSAASPPKPTFVASMKQAPALAPTPVAPMRRHSAVVESKRDIRQMNAKKLREMNFGGALGVAR
ncbi:hypothetical protein BG000_005500 [Podila horticola]|nr:hypothetical protein BG000_005500 [Podila horticola]